MRNPAPYRTYPYPAKHNFGLFCWNVMMVSEESGFTTLVAETVTASLCRQTERKRKHSHSEKKSGKNHNVWCMYRGCRVAAVYLTFGVPKANIKLTQGILPSCVIGTPSRAVHSPLHYQPRQSHPFLPLRSSSENDKTSDTPPLPRSNATNTRSSEPGAVPKRSATDLSPPRITSTKPMHHFLTPPPPLRTYV